MAAKSRKFDNDDPFYERRVTTEKLRQAVQSMLVATTEEEVVKAWRAARQIRSEGPLATLPDPMTMGIAKSLEASLKQQHPQSDLGIGRGKMLALLHGVIQSEIEADPEASNRKIARRLGISHNTVLKVRREMVT